MEANFTTLAYLLYRLMPFIMVGNFIVSSLINGEVKGFVYTIGLLFTYFISSSFMQVLQYIGIETFVPQNAKCNTFSVNGFVNPELSPGIIIFAYTFGYLLFTVIHYSLYTTNLPMMIFFTLLLIFELVWNHVNKCNNMVNQLALTSICLSLGILYSFLINKVNMRGLQYFNVGTNSEICSRPTKQKLKCTTYRDGLPVTFQENNVYRSDQLNELQLFTERDAWSRYPYTFTYIDGSKNNQDSSRYSNEKNVTLGNYSNESECENSCFGQLECSLNNSLCLIEHDKDTGDCYCKVKKLARSNLVNDLEEETDEMMNYNLTSFFNSAAEFLNVPQTIILHVGKHTYTQEEKEELETLDENNTTENRRIRAIQQKYNNKTMTLPLDITNKYYIDPIPVTSTGEEYRDDETRVAIEGDTHYKFILIRRDAKLRVIREDSVGPWDIDLYLRAKYGTSPFGDSHTTTTTQQ